LSRSKRTGRVRSQQGGAGGLAHSYPRSARVNEALREVLAEELERLEDLHEALGLLTITAVRCDPDLRHALVLLSSLSEEEEEALGKVRVRLQAAVGEQVRLKRTPQLRFAADPAVAAGERVDDILRGLHESSPQTSTYPSPAGPVDAGPARAGDGSEEGR
jgi:ribosome-binding factor A